MLEELEFVKQSDLDMIKSNNTVAKRRAAQHDIANDAISSIDPSKEYEYLLSMPLLSLTTEKIETLNTEAAKMDSKMDSKVDSNMDSKTEFQMDCKINSK